MKQLTKVIVFRVFSVLKMVWNRFSSVFSSENSLEWNSEFFFLPQMVRNGIPKFSLLKMVWKGIPWFYHSKMVWNGIPRVFFRPRNGSERNSEVFLFRETGGIPTELPSVPSCFVFRGKIFLSKNGNPTSVFKKPVGATLPFGQIKCMLYGHPPPSPDTVSLHVAACPATVPTYVSSGKDSR
jgi:hypothetical protein